MIRVVEQDLAYGESEVMQEYKVMYKTNAYKGQSFATHSTFYSLEDAETKKEELERKHPEWTVEVRKGKKIKVS